MQNNSNSSILIICFSNCFDNGITDQSKHGFPMFTKQFLFSTQQSKLPDIGLLNLEDPETGERITIDTSDSQTRKFYEDSHSCIQDEFARELMKRGIDEFHFSTDGDFSRDLFTFLKARGKRRY